MLQNFLLDQEHGWFYKSQLKHKYLHKIEGIRIERKGLSIYQNQDFYIFPFQGSCI